jgi:histone arginine demethylase JMJD6
MEMELVRSFKFWYRASINPRYWEVSCPQSPSIERIHWRDIGVEEFIERFEKTCKPVILTGFAERWEASKAWTAKTFSERYGEEVWRCGSGWKMRFHRYLAYLANRTDPLPLYLFDRRYYKIAPEINSEYGVPEYFPQDLFSLVGPKKRPPYRWILIGPGGSTVPFHVDPQGTSAWNVVVKGKKR